MHLLPPFRRRLVEVPLGLHHPLWIEDPDFDLDYHVRRVAVPAPGGQDELDELISQIASHQLDRRHPLWEVWVVEGLEHGHVGFVAKIHHCMADGVKAAELLVNVFDGSPDAPPPPPPVQPWQPEAVPSNLRLLGQALVDLVRTLLGVPALLARTLNGLRAVARRRRSGAVSPPLPFSAPATAIQHRAHPPPVVRLDLTLARRGQEREVGSRRDGERHRARRMRGRRCVATSRTAASRPTVR